MVGTMRYRRAFRLRAVTGMSFVRACCLVLVAAMVAFGATGVLGGSRAGAAPPGSSGSAETGSGGSSGPNSAF